MFMPDPGSEFFIPDPGQKDPGFRIKASDAGSGSATLPVQHKNLALTQFSDSLIKHVDFSF
jgi:hypothetical protein